MAGKKLKELALRLNGLSTPWFGVNWNPPEAQRTVAKRVLALLEDKRVLYAQHAWEVPQDCVQSVLDLRQVLSAEIGKLDDHAEISGSLRALRAACRKFLEALGPYRADMDARRFTMSHWGNRDFLAALGELRGVFGIHVAIMAEKFSLPVEAELASILPLPDDNEKYAIGDLRRSR